MKLTKYISLLVILFIVFIVIGIVFVISRNQKFIYKQGPIDIACTSEDGKLEEGGLCCSGYTEKINTDGSRTCMAIKNISEYSCEQDSDCGVNVCDCKVMNDKYIRPAEKACMRVCNGTPRCVKGVCRFQ